MLNEVKLRGNYKGIEYNHKGPAHLSIGQESTAVGQAYHLTVDDHIYGSHRSHGEILAKGLSAIEKLDEKSLLKIMQGYFGGDCLRVVEKDGNGGAKDLAMDFLIYGALAEIFGREPGLQQGHGRVDARVLPAVRRLSPTTPSLAGRATSPSARRSSSSVNHKPGIVIANIGDASLGCGPVWEGICFATMDQYKELWDKDHRGGLPLIFNFVNNFYGMGGQPQGETMGFKMLARLGAGINPQQCTPSASTASTRWRWSMPSSARRRSSRPATARCCSTSSRTASPGIPHRMPVPIATSRKSKPGMKIDPLTTFANQLVERKCLHANGHRCHARERADDGVQGLQESSGPGHFATGRPEEEGMPAGCDDVLEPEGRELRHEPQARDVAAARARNPRSKKLATLARSAFDEKGQKLPKAKCIGIRDAIFEAIVDRFYTDPTLVAYGEENRDWGGAFAVYRGLTEALPYHRLFNTPISEGAIVGTAVGYALEGGRVIAELMYCDFMGRAGDEIFNQLSKWQSMSGGLLKMPVVLRVSVGSKYGAQHSQDWSSMCAHIPGLKIVFPATPYDAKGLMYSALVGTDPVIFFESQRIYDEPEWFVKGGVPAGYYEMPIGEPDIKKPGKDLTILTIGATLYRGLEAAKALEEKYGVSCEVIDARSIVPFNYAKVIESVKKTRKIVLCSDACERGSALQTMAAKITQFAFDELDAPPTVVGARNWITPADEVEDAFFPYTVDILDAIHEHVLPLKGYSVSRDCSVANLMRRSTEGL